MIARPLLLFCYFALVVSVSSFPFALFFGCPRQCLVSASAFVYVVRVGALLA